MKQQFYALILSALLLPAGLKAQETSAPSVESVAAQRMAREVAALTNTERAAVGLPPLKLQENLQVAGVLAGAGYGGKELFFAYRQAGPRY